MIDVRCEPEPFVRVRVSSLKSAVIVIGHCVLSAVACINSMPTSGIEMLTYAVDAISAGRRLRRRNIDGLMVVVFAAKSSDDNRVIAQLDAITRVCSRISRTVIIKLTCHVY